MRRKHRQNAENSTVSSSLPEKFCENAIENAKICKEP
jgi:hypothetical protein